LNFEKNSKSGPSSGDDLLGCDLQVVEVILPSFQNFRTSVSVVLVKSLFLNKGAKIKEKEKGEWCDQARILS
jgi:hypothetical protein